MAKRIIIQYPNPLLLKQCRVVKEFDNSLAVLLDDMKETLKAANGAGLAAPQVSVLKRVCIVETDDGFYELINPEIIESSGTQTGYEGCLSVKGKYGTVTRAQNVTAKAQDRYGKEHIYKVSGFTARAFQHEIDHLNGKMYVDLVEGELCKG